jgi:hypothetical protein
MSMEGWPRLTHLCEVTVQWFPSYGLETESFIHAACLRGIVVICSSLGLMF